jgi:hypothetical protein
LISVPKPELQVLATLSEIDISDVTYVRLLKDRNPVFAKLTGVNVSDVMWLITATLPTKEEDSSIDLTGTNRIFQRDIRMYVNAIFLMAGDPRKIMYIIIGTLVSFSACAGERVASRSMFSLMYRYSQLG